MLHQNPIVSVMEQVPGWSDWNTLSVNTRPWLASHLDLVSLTLRRGSDYRKRWEADKLKQFQININWKYWDHNKTVSGGQEWSKKLIINSANRRIWFVSLWSGLVTPLIRQWSQLKIYHTRFSPGKAFKYLAIFRWNTMGCFCPPIVQFSSLDIFIMKSMFRA